MRPNALLAHFLITVLIMLPLNAQAQQSSVATQQPEETATVKILALNDRGAAISFPSVRTFESSDKTNLASKFHGGVAERCSIRRLQG